MSPPGHHLAGRAKHRLFTPLLILPALLIPLCFSITTSIPADAAGSSPTPEPDPLAVPVLPDNPSDIDLGRITYYYHCMPCHGDKGQGLTDEWRAVWVEDHQNCWSRGCHSGRPGDLGFPVPRFIPPVMPPFSSLARFESQDDLSEFLHVSHPPQTPGVLDEAECRTLAAYLTQSLPQGSAMGVAATVDDAGRSTPSLVLVTWAGVTLAATLGLAWLIGSREPH